MKPATAPVFLEVLVALLLVALIVLAGCAPGSAAASGSPAPSEPTSSTPTGAPAANAGDASTAAIWTSLQITHNWTKNQRPELDGQRLVWQAFDGLDWEIESYDLRTGVITQLTKDAIDETDPHLAGDRAIWIAGAPPQATDSQSLVPGNAGGSSLVLYDFAAGTATPIADSQGVEDAGLAGELAVWRSRNGADSDVYVCDLSTGKTTALTADHRQKGHPLSDGRLVVFTTNPGDGHSQVSAYDASTGATHRLSSEDASVTATSPQVNHGRVVWLESDGKAWSVFLWDVGTGTTQLLSRSDKPQASLGIGGDTVAWLRWNRADPYYMPHDSPWAVILYDLSAGRERQVAEDAFDQLWLESDGTLLVYTQFVFGGGSELQAYDPVTGLNKPLDPDPERLSIGGPPGDQIGGRGAATRGYSPTGDSDYVVGPSLNGGRIVFGVYQSVNGVYDDSDIVLAYRGGAPTAPAVPSPPTRRFADVLASPYRVAIEQLAARGIVRGQAVGGQILFSPGQPVLRWQFLRMVLEATGVRYPFYTNQPKFTDLIGSQGEDFFLRSVVAAGVELGITRGIDSSRFAPYAPISRAEAVTMLVRAAEAQRAGSTTTPKGYQGTLTRATGVHADSLVRAEGHGLLEGLVGFGANWDPQAAMTRDEAAQVLWNLMQRILEHD